MREHFELEDIRLDNAGRTVFVLRALPLDSCPECGGTEFSKSNRFVQTYETVSPGGESEMIEVRGRRQLCKSCGKIFYPIERGISLKYSEDFIERLAGKYLDSVPLETLSKEYGIKSGMIRTLIRNYFRKRDESADYRLPAYLGLEIISLQKKLMAVLFDAANLTLLDILPLEEVVLDDSIEEIIISDRNIEDRVKAIPGARKVVYAGESLFNEGIRALARDAECIDCDTDFHTIFKEKDMEKLYTLSSGTDGFFPVLLAYNFLLENADDREKLSGFDTPLENFGEFLENAAAGGEKSALRDELLEEYLRRSRETVRRLLRPHPRRISAEMIRGGELYLGNTVQSVKNDDGELIADFFKQI